ncbi:MAG TPA: hypothetical protein VIC28_13270 [Thermoanaerobaculia bacterium]|jgi:hypothetical protein
MGLATAAAARTALQRIAGRFRDEEARRRRRLTHPSVYEEIFRRAAEDVQETRKRLARERKHGQAQWMVLERHPQARRLVMIRNDRRLHNWGLFQVLLERSHNLAVHDARAAVQTAELALAVACCLDPETHGEERIADFEAAALAALADAKRRLHDRQGAWEAFEAARESLDEGTGDPLERAELEILKARLLRDFGGEEEPARSLRRAGKLLRSIGDKRAEGDLLEEPAPGARHDVRAAI